MTQWVTTTDFAFPNQTAQYHGKVRDTYTIGEDTLISIATDRISAFDVILPATIPYKGQVLNQLAAYFLKETADIIPNWLVSTPDPCVSIGKLASPIKVEVVVRGCLVGYAWRAYNSGERVLCGIVLPEGLKEYDRFASPIITPSTKAGAGHDEDISAEQIIAQDLATAETWQQISDYALSLFARGQTMAEKNGLVLADTKYEFGMLNGELILIDEIHTPDSSRYFYKDSYEAYVSGKSEQPPRHLSKEFVREWLMERNFAGKAGQTVPGLDDQFVQSVSDRYIELYEQLTGKKFEPALGAEPLQRIEANITRALQELAI